MGRQEAPPRSTIWGFDPGVLFAHCAPAPRPPGCSVSHPEIWSSLIPNAAWNTPPRTL